MPLWSQWHWLEWTKNVDTSFSKHVQNCIEIKVKLASNLNGKYDSYVALMIKLQNFHCRQNKIGNYSIEIIILIQNSLFSLSKQFILCLSWYRYYLLITYW